MDPGWVPPFASKREATEAGASSFVWANQNFLVNHAHEHLEVAPPIVGAIVCIGAPVRDFTSAAHHTWVVVSSNIASGLRPATQILRNDATIADWLKAWVAIPGLDSHRRCVIALKEKSALAPTAGHKTNARSSNVNIRCNR